MSGGFHRAPFCPRTPMYSSLTNADRLCVVNGAQKLTVGFMYSQSPGSLSLSVVSSANSRVRCLGVCRREGGMGGVCKCMEKRENSPT